MVSIIGRDVMTLEEIRWRADGADGQLQLALATWHLSLNSCLSFTCKELTVI